MFLPNSLKVTQKNEKSRKIRKIEKELKTRGKNVEKRVKNSKNCIKIGEKTVGKQKKSVKDKVSLQKSVTMHKKWLNVSKREKSPENSNR